MDLDFCYNIWTAGQEFCINAMKVWIHPVLGGGDGGGTLWTL